FCIQLLGGWFALLTPLVVTFVVVPIFDLLAGVDTRNPGAETPRPAARALLRLATCLAVPVEVALLLWGAWVVSRPSLPALDLAGAVLAAGIAGGVIGITVAHELIHRRSRLDPPLGGGLLASLGCLPPPIHHLARPP